jgi:hypothetical protein
MILDGRCVQVPTRVYRGSREAAPYLCGLQPCVPAAVCVTRPIRAASQPLCRLRRWMATVRPGRARSSCGRLQREHLR